MEDVEIAEDPVSISIREIFDAYQIDGYCRDILSAKGYETCQFIENDDGVLSRIATEEGATQQIVIRETRRPRLLNLTHHAKLADQPGQKKIYVRLKKSLYWPQMAAEVSNTVVRCPICGENRL